MKESGSDIAVTLDLNPSVAAKYLGVSLTSLTLPVVESGAPQLLAKTLSQTTLTAGNAPCTWSAPRGELHAQAVRLDATLSCPSATALSWKFNFVHGTELPSTFQVLVKADLNGTEHLYTADALHDSLILSRQPASQTGFMRFCLMGIEHIGAVPSEWGWPNSFHFPDGIDHILFLLGLILAGGSLTELVKTATGFTFGHSVTLAIATLGILRLPSRMVESCIALSIAYVAAEILFTKRPRPRWRIAAAFGLVHGFGFAAALMTLDLNRAEMAKALVGFNCGVEVGQIILITLLAPCVALLRRSFLKGYAVMAAAGGIFVTGAYWFVQRAFGF